MIRLTGRYQLLTDEFDVVDRVTDDIMNALMVNADITEPDVGVSLTEHLLEVWLVVPTDDVFEAIRRGSGAIAGAFAAAGLTAPPGSQTFVHPDLLGAETQITTELVPA